MNLQDQLAMQQIGMRTQRANFMNSANATFPNLNMVAGLNQGIGAGLGGGGGGGGFYGGGGSVDINGRPTGSQGNQNPWGITPGYTQSPTGGPGQPYGTQFGANKYKTLVAGNFF
jgi:hypothetical protein